MHQTPTVATPLQSRHTSEPLTDLKGNSALARLLATTSARFALKRFIEAGERELASLSEPELSAARERLHAEMLRKFMPEEPSLAEPRVRDVSIAECEADFRADAAEEAESDLLAKYDDPDDAVEPEERDGDREPRTHIRKTNVAKATAADIRSWDGRLKEKKMSAETYSHPVQAAGLECAGNHSAAPEPVEPVDLGDYFEERHADYIPTRPYHDRVAGVMFRAGQSWKKSSDLILHCERDGCGQVFQARQGTKYCSDNCRKRHHEEQGQGEGQC